MGVQKAMEEEMEELMNTDYLGMEEMSLLFNIDHNMLGIYQLPLSGEALCFATCDLLKKIGGKINKDNYKLVYTTELFDQIDLREVWEKFSFVPSNNALKMRPLSVSDVIVIHNKDSQKEANRAYYVNYGSFKELYNFFVADKKQIYKNLERLELNKNILAIKTATKHSKYFIFRCDPVIKSVEYSIYTNDFRPAKGGYVKIATLNRKMIYEVLDDEEIDMRKIEQVNYYDLIKRMNSESCDFRKKYNLL